MRRGRRRHGRRLRGVGLRGLARRPGADRLRQRGHADAADARRASPASRPASTLDGDESIRRRPMDRVAEPLAAMGRRVESDRRATAAARVAGGAAARDRLRAAGRQRAGEVGRAPRRAAGGRGDHGRRAAPDARPHRAHARRARERASRATAASVSVAAGRAPRRWRRRRSRATSPRGAFFSPRAVVPGSRGRRSTRSASTRARTGLLAVARAQMGGATSRDLQPPPDRRRAGAATSRSATPPSSGPRSARRTSRLRSTSCPSSPSPLPRAGRDACPRRRGAARTRSPTASTAVVEELRADSGADDRARPDGFVVHGDRRAARRCHRLARRPPHGDARRDRRPRVARGVEVTGVEAVSVSFPGFFDVLGRARPVS